MSLILKRIHNTKIIVNGKSYGFPHNTAKQHPNLGDEYKSYKKTERKQHWAESRFQQLFPQPQLPEMLVAHHKSQWGGEKGHQDTEDFCCVRGVTILHLLKPRMAQLCCLQIRWSWFNFHESANWVIQLNTPQILNLHGCCINLTGCQETPEKKEWHQSGWCISTCWKKGRDTWTAWFTSPCA